MDNKCLAGEQYLCSSKAAGSNEHGLSKRWPLPAKQIEIVRGIKKIPWIVLASVVWTLNTQWLASMLITVTGDQITIVSRGISPIVVILRTCSERQKKKPVLLSWLPFDCRTFDATSARDKVFALFRMAFDVDDPELEPDYEATPEQILVKSTARLLIHNYSSNRVLHGDGTGTTRDLSKLPSWVSDWSKYSKKNVLGAVSHLAHYRASWNVLSSKKATYGSENQSITLCGGISLTIFSTFAAPYPIPVCRLGNIEETKENSATKLEWLESYHVAAVKRRCGAKDTIFIHDNLSCHVSASIWQFTTSAAVQRCMPFSILENSSP